MAGAPGITEIRHAACEPHVVELCAFLRQLGVGITGGGSSTIRIEGGATLHGAEHRLWGDYIEAGSWAVVAAVTGGEIEISGARRADLEVLTAVFRRMQIECRSIADVIGSRKDARLQSLAVTSGVECRMQIRHNPSRPEGAGQEGRTRGCATPVGKTNLHSAFETYVD